MRAKAPEDFNVFILSVTANTSIAFKACMDLNVFNTFRPSDTMKTFLTFTIFTTWKACMTLVALHRFRLRKIYLTFETPSTFQILETFEFQRPLTSLNVPYSPLHSLKSL